MNKKIPFKNNFDTAKNFDKWSNYLLYFSTALLIFNFALGKFPNHNPEIIHWVDIVNCVTISLFALLEFVVDYIHFNAETYRRHDFVDNALGCKLAENRSQEYYTNDSLQNGLYKMGVNSFESCFFSYNIASKTLFCLWVKTILLSIAFLFFAISGYNEIAIFIIQLAIPLLLLQQAIKQQLYVVRLKEVLARYRTIFNNIKNVTEYNTAKLLREILEYEGIISWGNLLLDETTYNNLNAELSAQWEEKKKEYSIV